MTEQAGHSTDAAAERREASPAAQEKRERHELLVLKAGPRLLGVFADKAHRAVEWREPTPLPRAPQAILGVASVRGRMFTVVDPLLLPLPPPNEQHVAVEQSVAAHDTYGFIVPLRGDEQLALASDQAPRPLLIYLDQIEPSSQETTSREATSRIVLGLVKDEHGEQITVLNVGEIFAAAMQGSDRRRRRF